MNAQGAVLRAGETLAPVITTLAEYQTAFWIKVARHLRDDGMVPHFVSFDDRSTAALADAGFPVVSATTIDLEEHGGTARVLKDSGVSNVGALMAHERFAFDRNDEDAMADKLARAVLASERALNHAAQDGEPCMVQETGGFLSVWGAFIAARRGDTPAWFIEPSFFRGRMLVSRGSMASPRIPADCAAGTGGEGAAAEAYIDAALESGSLVIPEKDRHQYTSALRKMATARNAVRLGQKLFDKYALGKTQEFGFIGHHVATHARTIANSNRLRGAYTRLDRLGPFVYYPFHVPGDMALTVRSPEYLDQLAIVDYLARTLPDGYRLAVKEHPAMVGMIEVARLKRMLKRYPRLALLPPTSNNYSVMRAAAAVVTVNSKSGAEAGLLGRPVIVMGDAFYRQAPFARPVERLADVPGALDEALASDEPPDMKRVRAWFRGAWSLSLPGELYTADPGRIAKFAASLAVAIRRGSEGEEGVPHGFPADSDGAALYGR